MADMPGWKSRCSARKQAARVEQAARGGIFMDVAWVSQPWPPAALAIAQMVSERLKSEAHIRIYTGNQGGGPDDVWLCFDCADRSFGIWRATMALYEADEHGAMGEDPIDPAAL